MGSCLTVLELSSQYFSIPIIVISVTHPGLFVTTCPKLRRTDHCGNIPMIPLSAARWARQARALTLAMKEPRGSSGTPGHVFSVRGLPESLLGAV